MSTKKVLLALLCCALTAHGAMASGPTMSVTPSGIVGGNRQWLVNITPDAALFSNNPPNGVGGSLAAELGFTIGPGTLLGVVKNATNWPFDNPGNSPFGPPINGVQFGEVMSGNNSFTALGSNYFTTSAPESFVTITTAGTGLTTVSWLGAYSGKGRIAQGGVNFDVFSGSVSVPEPASASLAILGLTATFLFARRRRAVKVAC
jgi:hypothetical protein